MAGFQLLVITAVAAGGHHGGLGEGGGGGERGCGRLPICAGRGKPAGKLEHGGAAGPGGRAGGVVTLASRTRPHRHPHLLLRHRPPRLLPPLQVHLSFTTLAINY